MIVPFEALVGPAYTAFSSKADVQLSVNCYRQRVQSGQGVNPYVLYKSFGITPYITDIPAGVHRGSYELNGHAFYVVGNTVYEYIDAVQQRTYGPIANDGLPVFMAASEVSLLIVSANTLYRINAATLSTPATSFTPGGIAFLKNYFVSFDVNTNDFYFSSDDGATWPAGNIQTAEADANFIVAIMAHQQLLWLIGNRITQVFYVVANADAPFSPVDSGVIQSGAKAAASVRQCGESLIWLERNKEGEGSVVMTSGFSIARVSDYFAVNFIESLAQDFDISDAIGMSFTLGGQDFYRLTFPSADKTLEFNRTEKDWEELQWFNWRMGTFHRHRGNTIVAASGKILVGDHTNGIVYEMGVHLFTDYGFPLRGLRRTPHIVNNNRQVWYGRMDLGCETGVALLTPLWLNDYSQDAATFAANLATAVAGATVTAAQAIVLQQIYDFAPYTPLDPYPDDATMTSLGFYKWGDDPQIELQYSNDGGETFSGALSRSMGRVGQKRLQPSWNRLGEAEDRVFQLTFSDPVKYAITNAWLDIEETA